jgi:uncharacterized glyoxalase superfamily protein PhnB
MEDPFRRPVFSSGVFYRDPAAALEWLAKAFGFERAMVITDDSGAIVHSEMRFRGGVIYVGAEWADFTASPANTGRRCTQTIHVQLDEDVDAHCARSREAGAEILREPEDQFYGDRTYQARDPEGHVWSFARTVKTVSREEAEAASGLRIEGWTD